MQQGVVLCVSVFKFMHSSSGFLSKMSGGQKLNDCEKKSCDLNENYKNDDFRSINIEVPLVKRVQKQWCRIKALLCFTLLLLATPFCFVVTFSGWLLGKKTDAVLIEKSARRTVLVSGAAHTKGLHLVRTLAKVGHRVILADCKDFWCSGARWSRYVSKFYTVPNVKSPQDSSAYVDGLIDVALKEKIDWYIPVSHTKTAFGDTIFKHSLAITHPEIKCLVFDDPNLTAVLDDKVLFLSKCLKLQLPVPSFRIVSDLHDIIEMCKHESLFSSAHYFLKPLMPYSEDRLNFTPIPSNVEELEEYLLHYKGKVSEKSPSCVQQFVKGKEYAVNAIVCNGKIQAFNVCPCSPMQIDYDVVNHSGIRHWVETFCKAMNITGCIAFDFVEDTISKQVYCIECNPRLHSSVVCFQENSALESAIRGAMEPQFQLEKAAEPPADSAHVYWLYNEIAKLGLGQQGIREFITTLSDGKDAVWDAGDPLPFFLLNHFQMPIMLLHALISGKKWNITNYCLGQLR